MLENIDFEASGKITFKESESGVSKKTLLVAITLAGG